MCIQLVFGELKEVKPNQFHIIFFNSNIIKSMEYILHTYPVKHGRLNTHDTAKTLLVFTILSQDRICTLRVKTIPIIKND